MGDFEAFSLPGIKILSLPSDCGNFALVEEEGRQAFKPGAGQQSARGGQGEAGFEARSGAGVRWSP